MNKKKKEHQLGSKIKKTNPKHAGGLNSTRGGTGSYNPTLPGSLNPGAGTEAANTAVAARNAEYGPPPYWGEKG